MKSFQPASVPLSYQRLAVSTKKTTPFFSKPNHTGPTSLRPPLSSYAQIRSVGTMECMAIKNKDNQGSFCWLSVQQVCECLGVSTSTFYKWRASRKGPRTKRLPNGELRVRQDWLNDFMDDLPEEVA